MATREDLEAVIRDQLGRVVANALEAGVPSRGMFNRAVEEITKAAESYALTAYIAIHYMRPLSNRSACGRSLGGRTDPRQVTCASCKRTKCYRASLQEMA